MSRPGFVLDVDHSTPPVLFWRGERFTTEKLPAGARVIYAPEPVAALEDPDAAVRDALARPVAGEPLRALLRPDMRLTIAFDDVSSPLPQTAQPDPRQRVIEAVLDLAAEVGVDDVELVAAIGLRRRMTEGELRRLIGDRVYEAFAAREALHQHDAEDPDRLTDIGTTENGEPVAINARVAASDLVVYVGVSVVPTDGGHAGIAEGLGAYRTIQAQHAVDQGGGVDDLDAPLQSARRRVGHVIERAIGVFQVEVTLDTNTFPHALSFLQRREAEWTVRDRVNYLAADKATGLASPRLARKAFRALTSPTAITSVQAGPLDAVHARSIEHIRAQQVTPVQGQTDIVTFGIPHFAADNANAILNPVLVAFAGLGRFFNLYAGKPVVREGGVVILHHPTRREFDPVHHPSHIDFFEQVLPETTDAATIRADYEEKFATDTWYSHLYRTGTAYHGVHPLHLWYSCAQALQHVGGVIVVGGDRAAVKRLGFRPASTFFDALEMASDITRTATPTVTHLHAPPMFLAEVH